MAWPALPFAHVEVGRDRRQQADRHEFGGDQRADASVSAKTAPQEAAAGCGLVESLFPIRSAWLVLVSEGTPGGLEVPDVLRSP